MQAPQNRDCSPRIMTVLNDILNQSNPYVEVYKNMRLLEQQEEERARRANEPPRTCELRFKRGNDIRRYNFLTSNEIAAVFVGENGAPPEERDTYCCLSKKLS
jgi:hypothetical protein